MTTANVPPVQEDWCVKARAILKLKYKKKNVFKRAASTNHAKELKLAKANIDQLLGTLKTTAAETVWSPKEARYKNLVTAIIARLAAAEGGSKSDIDVIVAKVGDLHTLADELKQDVKDAAAAKIKLDVFNEKLRVAKRDMAILDAANGECSNLQNYINQATHHGTALAYSEADSSLALFKTELATQQKAVKAAEARQLLQLGLAPEYTAKLEEVEQVLAEIRDLPGVGAVVAEYEKIIAAAKKKAATGDHSATTHGSKRVEAVGNYEAALAELKAAKTLKKPSDCEQMSKDALASFEANNEAARGVWDAAHGALADLARIALNEEVQSWREQITSFGGKMVSDSPEAATSLGKLTTEMIARGAKLRAWSREAQQHLENAITHRQTLRQHAGMEIVAPLSQRLEYLQTTLTANRIEEAHKPSADLEKEMKEAADMHAKAAADWSKTEPARTQAITDLDDMIGNCPPVKQRAMQLKGQISTLKTYATINPKDPAGATEQLARLQAELTALGEQFDLFKAIDNARNDANDAREKFEGDSKQALNALRAAIATERAKPSSSSSDGTDSFVPFHNDCGELLDRWQRAIDSALTEPALKTNAFATQAKELLQRIKDASSGETLTLAVGAQEQDEARRLYELKHAELLKAIDGLSDYDYTDSDALTVSVKAVAKDASKDYVAAVSALEILNTSCTRKLASAKSTQLAHKAALDHSVADVQELLKKLKKAMKGHTFDPFIEKIESELSDMSGMFSTTNINTMQAASEDLLGLKKRMSALLADMMASDTTNFHVVGDTIKAIGKKLGDDSGNESFKALTECAPAKLEFLKKSFETTKEDAFTELPSKAIVTLQTLDKQVNDAADVAKTAKALRDAFATDVKVVKAKIKQFNKKHSFLDGINARLAKAVERATLEGQESKAQNDLTELKIELNRAISNPAYLQTLDEAANAKALKAEQDAVVWAKQLQIFEKADYNNAKVAVKTAKGDGTLIDELDRMIKSMKDLAKAGSFDDANQQLIFAKQRVRDIIKRPEGPTIGSRNDLPKDLKVFKAAVTKYNAAMAAFPAAVKALEDDTTPVAPASHTAIKNITAKVQSDIPPNSFDQLVTTLSNKTTDRNKRRAARESALSLIRTYRTRLQASKTMQELISNPIDRTQIPAAMSGMYYSLNRLEGNVMRCCK